MNKIRQVELGQLAKPLAKLLQRQGNPHASIIITTNHVTPLDEKVYIPLDDEDAEETDEPASQRDTPEAGDDPLLDFLISIEETLEKLNRKKVEPNGRQVFWVRENAEQVAKILQGELSPDKVRKDAKKVARDILSAQSPDCGCKNCKAASIVIHELQQIS